MPHEWKLKKKYRQRERKEAKCEKKNSVLVTYNKSRVDQRVRRK